MRRFRSMTVLSFLCALGALAAAGLVWAADPAATPAAAPASPWTLFMPVVVTLVPIIVMYAKKLIPTAARPFIPIVAIVLGPIVDFILSWFTGKAADPTAGAMYGAFGLALREVVDQVRKADWSPDSWTPKPVAKIIAWVISVPLLLHLWA